MAGCTGARRNAGMAETRRQPVSGASVTGIATCRSEHVRRVLAGGPAAIVASGAGSRCHTLMVERPGLPGKRGMTGFARGRGLNVPSRFPRRHDAVMTGATASRHDALMAELRRGPGRGGMACLASRRGRDMVALLAHRGIRVAGRMTGCALLRRPLEHAVDVAGFAPDLQMSAGQIEAGLEMVESDLSGCSVRRRHVEYSDHQHENGAAGSRHDRPHAGRYCLAPPITRLNTGLVSVCFHVGPRNPSHHVSVRSP